MRDILFLAHRLPYPPDRGDRIRSWHILKYLAGKARVHVAALADSTADADAQAAMRDTLGEALGDVCVAVRPRFPVLALTRALVQGQPLSLAMFDHADIRRFVAAKLADENVGTIFAFSSQMAQFVPADARQNFIMDFVDVDSAKFDAYAAAGGPKAWLYAREGRALAAWEGTTARRASASLFVSQAEANLFTRRSGIPGTAVSNGIDLAYYQSRAERPEQPPLIVFTGQMDYAPNVEAVTAFANGDWPRIRRACPDARFAIVGRNPAKRVMGLGAVPGIEVTGAVADVRDWLARATVAVAPLKTARGIQNKVLEAMAMAKPVVASPAAFEGIEAEAGQDLIVSDNMAASVIDLLANPQRAEALGQAARRRVEAAYDWDARLKSLDALLEKPQG